MSVAPQGRDERLAQIKARLLQVKNDVPSLARAQEDYLLERLERAEAEREEYRAAMEENGKAAGRAWHDREKAEARVVALEEALRPFVEQFDDSFEYEGEITVAMIKTARTALGEKP